jgi:peptidoglycan/LPS O-acetylase OafA/YrhL
MSRNHRKALLRLVVLVVLVSLVIPTVFGSPGNTWRDYIYEFQTLIGGLLALGAAYLTLGQMQESDEMQSRRHNLQMAVANRRVSTAEQNQASVAE